jgi:phosphoserine phosphatase RsbU/P
MRERPHFVLALIALPLLSAGLQLALDVRFLSLSVFALAPLVASMVFGWRGTALWSLYALAVALPMTIADTTFSTRLDLVRLLSLSPVLAFAVGNSLVRERRDAHLRDVLAVSRVAQSTILRELPPVVAGVPVVARYRSAAAESQVGGDIYEVVPCNGGLRLVVADVRGKGLDAVRTAARTVAAFRDAAEDASASLLDVVAAVDRSASRELADEDFVTAVFAELTAAGLLRLANCGHPPPIRLAQRGEPVHLSPSTAAPPLGLGPAPAVDEHLLEPGARVLFFSDGLIEARDGDGAFFGLERHVAELARGGLVEGVDRLLTRLDEFSRSLPDDLVLLALERPVSAQARSTRVALDQEGRPAAQARRIVQEVLAEAGLVELADDAALLTHELVTNAVLHTGQAPTLEVQVASDRVRVEVHDPSPVHPVVGLLDPAASSGRGLTLVQRLAADWGVALLPAGAVGKAVWFSLDRGNPEQAAEPTAEQLLDLWDDTAGPDDRCDHLDRPGTEQRSADRSPGEELRRVLLPGLDTRAFVAARAHIEDLLREMVMVAAARDGASSPPTGDDEALVDLARRLGDLAGDLADFRRGMRQQAVAAEAGGAPCWDLELTVPVTVRTRLLAYRRALDEADLFCQQGRLLIPPAPEAAAFRRWKLDRILEQLGSDTDRPESAPGSERLPGS